MTFNIPYSFVPGTKAKAEEVNANFISIVNEVNEQVESINTAKANKDLSNISSQGVENLKNIVGNGKILGELVVSHLPLTDAGLHLLDGSLLSGSGSYSDFIDYIANLYGDGTNVPSYFCTESDWQSSVTNYGVCGKFVYDSVNNTVRLPKITGIIEGTTDVTALGDLIEAGLPNITGEINANVNTNTKGAFSTPISSMGSQYGLQGVSAVTNALYLDASNSNSIYGNSSTVQPQTIKALYYIVIATSSKTDIQVDIDEIATDLNGKADVDLENVATGAFESIVGIAQSSGKATVVNWCMPDYTAGVSISYNTNYSCPSDGIVVCQDDIIINGTQIYTFSNYSGYNTPSSMTALVCKEDIVKCNNSGTFYPLKGVN